MHFFGCIWETFTVNYSIQILAWVNAMGFLFLREVLLRVFVDQLKNIHSQFRTFGAVGYFNVMFVNVHGGAHFGPSVLRP